MVIIGTGGLASDIVSSMEWDVKKENVVFFNDTEIKDFEYIQNNFQIFKTKIELITYLKDVDNRFIVAIGDAKYRKMITLQLEQVGGINVNYISEHAFINQFATLGEKGIIILGKTLVTNSVKVGNGSVLYSNVNLAHQVEIGEYCLISAGVNMSYVKIGDNSFVGIGATIKPGIEIAKDTTVGIGSVLLKNTEKNGVYIGNPAKLYKSVE